MKNLFEQGNVVSILYPSDTQTAVADDYINVSHSHALEVIVFIGAGTAGDDPDIHFFQATTNAGAGAKALQVDRYYKKEGTLLSTSSVGGVFTLTTMTASDIVDLGADSAEVQGIYGFHIEADTLDVSNGFKWVQVSIPDTGSASAQYGCILGVLIPGRYQQENGGLNPL